MYNFRMKILNGEKHTRPLEFDYLPPIICSPACLIVEYKPTAGAESLKRECQIISGLLLDLGEGLPCKRGVGHSLSLARV